MLKRILLIGCLLLSACSTLNIERVNHAKNFDLNKTLYIARSKNGTYDNILYEESGKMTTDAISNTLYLYANKIIKGTEVENKQQALETSKKVKADIVIIPTILHWEDRATQWSGVRDKVKILVEIINIKNNETIDKATIYATNSVFTFINAPTFDLLPKMFEKYFKSIIQIEPGN